MATKDKNVWLLMIFILSGIVIGGLLGEFASNVDWLWWLSYGQEFGITTPFSLDLHVIKITFSVVFKINIASIIGIGISLWLYRKA
ncbi:MAG: DUF4321 domain-containing protein [Clostridia bacterium]|nr:DUF4321 domain-containing protein [Clostridia bacterium]